MGEERVLIPGAGYGQAIIAQKAREMGLIVVMVSPPGDYPGFEFADRTYHEDVRNREAVLRIARDERIHGIVSDQNDIPVETMGYVVENLGLIGNDYATSRLFTHKDLMRERCREIGVPSIGFGSAASVKEALAVGERVGFPVMCKPVDNQSSKGVFRAENLKALEVGVGKALENSFSGRVIIEQFIQGREYCVESMALNGALRNLLLLERTYFRHDDVFVPSMVTSPTDLGPEAETELMELNRTICESFGLRYGFSHSEFIRSDVDGRFYLVETAARGGGVFISSHLVAHACGFDTAEFLVRMAVGEDLDIEDYANRGKAVRYMCFYLASGSIRDVQGIEEIRGIPAVLDVYGGKLNVGHFAQGLVDKSSRLGPVLLGADSLDEIHQATESVREALVISTEDSSNAVIWE